MAKQAPYSEDLFKDSTMTFGQHLDELRSSLFKALMGLVLTCGVGFYFGNDLVKFIQTPFQDALKDYYRTEAEQRYAAWLAEKTAAGLRVPDNRAEVQYLVQNRQLQWKETYFQFTDLVSAVRSVYPAADIRVPFLGEHALAAEDFPADTAIAFCQALKAAEQDSEQTPTVRLWSRLGADRRAAISAAAAGSDPAAAQAALAALDDLLDLPDLYDPAVFENVALFGEAQLLLQRKDSLSAEEFRRFNRLLLEAVFREQAFIAPTQPKLMTLFTWQPLADDDRVKLITMSAHEAFSVWMKASILLGLVLGSPWVFYQIWMFVAAGLYPHEKSYVYRFLPISVGLFLAGASFAYVFVFQPVLKFLLWFNFQLGINPSPRITEWLSFVLFMPLGFGISFQLPLVMFFLDRIGLVGVELFRRQWRISILAITLISMVLTPSDPWSMLLMAVPLSGLYFVGIAMCLYFPRVRNPFAEPPPAGK